MLKMLFIGIFGLQVFFLTVSAIEAEKADAQVQERLQQFAEAINQGRLETLSSFWTEDAELIRPLTGEAIEGKNDINTFLQKSGQEFKNRHLHLTFTPNSIDFRDSETAVVTGIVEITDKGELIQRNARRIALVKEDVQWYIDQFSEIEVPPPPPVYNAHLKDLDWLVGKWTDKDENVTNT